MFSKRKSALPRQSSSRAASQLALRLTDAKKEKRGTDEELLPIQGYADDDLGGQTDDDVVPVPVMDEEFKEALLDNEDWEGDDDEELPERAGACTKDEESSD